MQLRKVGARVLDPLRPAAPFLAAVACALVAVAVAGTSPADRPATQPRQRVAATLSAPPAADALTISHHLPIAEVATHYRDVAMESADAKRVAKFRPLYDEAERTFGVNWRLIASIHRQETAFSAAKSTYHGRNFANCCAGPMQFNVTNGPVSTWRRYRDAFRQGLRPAHYPHRTANHPSIYDDYDAIMAAGKLLRDSGADESLGRDAWNAAYDYYGHDAFGITYADQVTARAIGWARSGFCANCDLAPKIVSEQDKKYGAAEHKTLVVAVAHQTADRTKAPAAKAPKPVHARKQRRARGRSHRRRVAAEKAARARALQQLAGRLGRRVGRTRSHLSTPTVHATPTPTPRPETTTTPPAATSPEPTPIPEATPSPDGSPGPTGDPGS